MNGTDRFTIYDLIYTGNQDPDQNAIESPGSRPLTYRALRAQMARVLQDLHARGFLRNDRIAIITPPGPETAVCIVSVMAGFTVLSLNPQSKEKEFSDIFSRTGIKGVIVQKGHETAATAVAKTQDIPLMELVPLPGAAGKFMLLPETSSGSAGTEFAASSDTAYVLLTSGTTAVSKIVPVTHTQSAVFKKKIIECQKINSHDRCLHILPYYHGMGISAPLLCPLFAGATVICTKDFIPSDFFGLLRTFRPTYYVAGPTLNQGILHALKKIPPADLRNHSLRYIRCGSGSLPEKILRELESVLGVRVIVAYGMSEAGTIAINIAGKRGSVGIPLVESIAIIDGKNERLNRNCVGEIIVRDPAVFSGYEDAPDENSAAFIDGWFRTGDMGYLDSDGYLFLTGRKKELINKGGEKISPEEIDTVLKSHPRVRDAMTFRIADPVLGEDVAALIVPADNLLTETDLRHFLLDRLIQFKIPKKIWFVDKIPKTPTGKPMRHKGTQRYS